MSHGDTMDRVYRFQRHLYDATRPLFLIGRNRLLDGMATAPGMQILEMGCGTARNLIAVAKRHPSTRLFGVDISSEMLKTAQKNIRASRCVEQITVANYAAEKVHYRDTFALDRPFDIVFFSYSLSMMPTFAEALEAARQNLADTGGLHVVDFCDAAAWPAPARHLLAKWLGLFHVRFKKEILSEIGRQFGHVAITPLWGRYAFIARACP